MPISSRRRRLSPHENPILQPAERTTSWTKRSYWWTMGLVLYQRERRRSDARYERAVRVSQSGLYLEASKANWTHRQVREVGISLGHLSAVQVGLLRSGSQHVSSTLAVLELRLRLTTAAPARL